MNFEEKLINAFEKKILNEIESGYNISVGCTRYSLPDEVIQEVYQNVDMNKVKKLLIEHIEEIIAQQIINSMMTEIKNDVKKIVATKQIREDMQYYLRKQMEQVFSTIEEE